MGFNSAFKGLIVKTKMLILCKQIIAVYSRNAYKRQKS